LRFFFAIAKVSIKSLYFERYSKLQTLFCWKGNDYYHSIKLGF
jgi:hypothetical protein